MSEKQRIDKIYSLLRSKNMFLNIILLKAQEDGQVIISLKNKLSASERGIYILNFELLLKKYIDGGICVWCETLGDKNSLRNLRGIKFK